MKIEAWLQAAIADLERRGARDAAPFVEALARATEALRAPQLDALLEDERAAHSGGDRHVGD